MKQIRHTHGARRSCVLLALAWATLATMATMAAAATLCPETGEPAPAVVTLMASKTDPAADAWIVSPNCSVETIQSTKGIQITLTAESRGVERVASIPTSVQHLFLGKNSLIQGADLSSATELIDATIVYARSDYRDLILPRYLETLSISSSTETAFGDLKLPSSLQTLSVIGSHNLKTLRNVQFPPWLRVLQISDSNITANDFQFLPATIERLFISSSPIGNLENVPLPSSLESFKCYTCGIERIRGVKWPTSIREVDLIDENITALEIRQSDVVTFQNLSFVGAINQSTCPGLELSIALRRICVETNENQTECAGSEESNATTPCFTESIVSTCAGPEARICVISDREFKSRYSTSEEDSPSLGLSSASMASSSSTTGLQDTPSMSSLPSLDESTSEAAKNSNSVFIILVIVALAVFAVVALYYVIARRSKRRHAKESVEASATDAFVLVDTPNTSSERPTSSEPTVSTSGSLPIDIRNDKDLERWRINHVYVGKQIARGGYGVVYRGTYQDRAVAIKQMYPDAWRNDTLVMPFLDEIRLCARLSHPKIVEFIGVAWTSLRDLSVVTAFIAGGDLHSVLRANPESSGAEWTRPWSPHNLRSKTLIAMDITEAVMYLHSFDTPIIHRDLKAKNALMDAEGNVKLSDFGISRTVSVDETMTSEIGTVAWIAPEVLRGERYSEQADIYSLGVLLVELDRCTHPYAKEPVLSSGDLGSSASDTVRSKNTQIMILVSTGVLKPSPSRGCPESVSALIARCVSFDPRDRPTAPEILRQLHQFELASTSGH